MLIRCSLFVLMSASCSLLPSDSDQPGPLRLALIADCQYADAEDRGQRLYRRSPAKLQEAVDTLAALEPHALLHLGDFIDRDWESFETVVPILASMPCPVHHVLGNHDFEVADERKLDVPGQLGREQRWAAVEVQGWRILILDGNDFSYSAWPEQHPRAEASRRFHAEVAPDAPTWNGGIGPEQMAWLRAELVRADREGTPLLVACHFPLWPDNVHNLWNAEEVRELLCAHSSVKIYLNGHNHAGNFAEREELPFVTLEGMLDTEENAFAILEIDGDHAEITAWGRATPRTLRLRGN